MTDTQNDYILSSDLDTFTITLEQAAEHLGCSQRILSRLIQNDPEHGQELETVLVDGENRVSVPALLDYLERRNTAGAYVIRVFNDNGQAKRTLIGRAVGIDAAVAAELGY
ncbi:hypothetical protein [Leifsonia sp. Leaf264]|uniref:hypothetical protein n=1 Tax=Leifsonia sp. Leaf264 TaxID=1736314 RepID=UPI0006F4F65A|nr:hypothetical protein [Leifsonia sp. Leaf264]KQO98163.1 hypothetical protein ASF30_08875 [Leifsonia sp. Leaf264]